MGKSKRIDNMIATLYGQKFCSWLYKYKLNLLVKLYEKQITGTYFTEKITDSYFSIFWVCSYINPPLTKLQLFRYQYNY